MEDAKTRDWLISYRDADARLERVKTSADKLEVSESIKDVWRAACDCCIAQLVLAENKSQYKEAEA